MCLYLTLLHIHVLRTAHFQRTNRSGCAVGLENEVFLGADRPGLHGGDAGEDVEELGVP